jgi:hypothetical protein
MKNRKMRGTFGLCAAATMASLAVASPAFAWDETMYTDDGDPGGRVRFETDGDVVELCDIEADGYAVYLSVYDNTSHTFKYSYTIGGNGRCQTLRASLGGNYDLAEGHVFRFRICLARDNNYSYCDDAYWDNNNRFAPEEDEEAGEAGEADG